MTSNTTDERIVCTPLELEKNFQLLQEKFFTDGIRGEATPPPNYPGLNCDIKITLPHRADHFLDVKIAVVNDELDENITDDDLKNRDVVVGKMYLNFMKLVGQRIIGAVGSWMVDENSTLDNRAFLNHNGISDRGAKLLHEDEAKMIEIAQAMVVASEDKSFRLHYNKELRPFGSFNSTDINDAVYAYKAVLRKADLKGKAIRLGRVGDVKDPQIIEMTFCSPTSDVSIQVYANEVEQQQLNSNDNGVKNYFNLIKMLLAEKLMDASQNKTLSYEEQSYFVRRMMLLEK